MDSTCFLSQRIHPPLVYVTKKFMKTQIYYDIEETNWQTDSAETSSSVDKNLYLSCFLIHHDYVFNQFYLFHLVFLCGIIPLFIINVLLLAIAFFLTLQLIVL